MPNDPYRATKRARPLVPRAPLDGRRPRVLAHVHMYVPEHNAGAEVMLHTMLRDLVGRGWDAQVVTTQYRGKPYTIDDVHVQTAPIDTDLRGVYEWADVVVTHLDATGVAMRWSRHGRPLVHVVHNHRQLDHHHVQPRFAQLVVWNSRWVAEHYKTWPGDSIIVRPPVSSADYATANENRPSHGFVTLLNLTEAKGGPMLWRLARSRPGMQFLGVKGSYGGQHVPDTIPANAHLLANTPNVLPIYQHTRVLIVPSSYESWGRVAVEAMASGIPVVAHPTPGLVEALTLDDGTPAALFADRDSDTQWLDALDELSDVKRWCNWSMQSLRRAAELDTLTRGDLNDFAERMLTLAQSDVP